jgi:putative transposase
VNVATVIATGVSAEGHREILGVDMLTDEDGAAWTAFPRDLVARGLAGVQLVISPYRLPKEHWRQVWSNNPQKW